VGFDVRVDFGVDGVGRRGWRRRHGGGALLPRRWRSGGFPAFARARCVCRGGEGRKRGGGGSDRFSDPLASEFRPGTPSEFRPPSFSALYPRSRSRISRIRRTWGSSMLSAVKFSDEWGATRSDRLSPFGARAALRRVRLAATDADWRTAKVGGTLQLGIFRAARHSSESFGGVELVLDFQSHEGVQADVEGAEERGAKRVLSGSAGARKCVVRMSLSHALADLLIGPQKQIQSTHNP
jgi:hypothetical protein